MGNNQLRIQDLNLSGHLKVAGRHLLGALGLQSDTLGLFRKHFQANLFEVEQYGYDIFFDTGESGEFVIDPVYFDGSDSRAGKGRKNYPPERVAQSIAVPG